MNKETVKVVVDVHEPTLVQEEFEGHPEVEEVGIAPLSSADVVVGGVGFERKTWNDFASSLIEGRLEDQIGKMGDAFEHAYVLIEGNLDGTEFLQHTQMSEESLRGAVASFTAREEYGVRAVLPCSNPALLADMAVRLARKHSEDPSSAKLPGSDVGSEEPTTMQMYGCIPGIGRETAETLYSRFPQVGAIAHASVEDIAEVEGVGDKRARKVKDVFRL